MSIGNIVAKQFAQMWEMFREAIGKFPEEQWRVGDHDWQIPARLASHIIEGADYLSQATPEGYSPASPFGAYWEAKPEHLATKEQILTQLNEVRTQVEAWLNGVEDSDLLSPNSDFPPWESILERALALLRDAQHHVGQLNADLRRRGLPTAEWR